MLQPSCDKVRNSRCSCACLAVAAACLYCADDWVEQQTKAYVGWVNTYLGQIDEPVTNLSADLADGVRLLHLVELLEERNRLAQQATAAVPSSHAEAEPLDRFSPFTNYHHNPKLKFHKIENTDKV